MSDKANLKDDGLTDAGGDGDKGNDVEFTNEAEMWERLNVIVLEHAEHFRTKALVVTKVRENAWKVVLECEFLFIETTFETTMWFHTQEEVKEWRDHWQSLWDQAAECGDDKSKWTTWMDKFASIEDKHDKETYWVPKDILNLRNHVQTVLAGQTAPTKFEVGAEVDQFCEAVLEQAKTAFEQVEDNEENKEEEQPFQQPFQTYMAVFVGEDEVEDEGNSYLYRSRLPNGDVFTKEYIFASKDNKLAWLAGWRLLKDKASQCRSNDIESGWKPWVKLVDDFTAIVGRDALPDDIAATYNEVKQALEEEHHSI